jgi:hypothetical protein
MRNKRGQFYLLAAIIIIAVIIGFAVISSAPKKNAPQKLYDLGNELGIESQNVLAYGTYNELNDTQMTDLLQQFIAQYVNYAGQGRNLYFIFGNSNKVTVMAYQQLTEEKVTVNAGSGYQPLVVGGVPQQFSPTGTKVTIKIGTQTYSFNLQVGQNFYFVISQEIQGEKYVITNQ